MTARERRTLRLAAAVVVTALLLKAAPGGVMAELSSRRALLEKVGLLTTARSLVRGIPDLADSAGPLRTAVIGLAPVLLSGATDADAMAALGGRLRLIIERGGGRLHVIAPVVDSQAAGLLRRATVHASFEADLRSLSSILEAIAGSDVVLSAQEVEVTALDPSSVTSSPSRLKVWLTVAGWYQPRTGA